MFAQVIRDSDPNRFHFCIEQFRHQRQTTSTAVARFGAGFQLPHTVKFVVANRLTDRSFGYIIAGTDLSLFRHAFNAADCGTA